MKIDVEVISREIIKPTTSPHDCYKFSLLDQVDPSWYLPFIYFYSVDHKTINKNEISKNLKTSLSQVLNNYYLLAGNDVNNLVLAVQLNFFNYGGIAIGIHMSHKIADGSSIITFMKNWAETACNSNINYIGQKIMGTTMFSPIDYAFDDSSEYPSEKNIISKRFVFSNSNISILQVKYIATSSMESSKIYQSRFKTLPSFLWSCFTASTEIKKGPKTSYSLASAMNLRKKIDPPLLDDSFGNVSGIVTTMVSSEDDIKKEGYNYGIVN
ncbi:hypothetical protein Ddye_025721 [Dipteronia dyeriana]|uniref:Uncharacterized protein n=1 Tax=Dipteronia dyeriana TaxID=168575 RepID=A0AAD9TLD9_9ROSI|nr:hypothetical protein Ddye_025721 [Dipteronia dyeriana]